MQTKQDSQKEDGMPLRQMRRLQAMFVLSLVAIFVSLAVTVVWNLG